MLGIAEIESRRRVEQESLDRLKGAEERNKLGQFATPNALAVAIVNHLLRLRGDRPDPIRFLDPSIGTGSFYSALRQSAPPGTIVDASGIEIDPGFAESAARLWSTVGLRVTAGDFTRLEPPPPGGRANLILANPPYVRHHHLDRSEKRRLQDLVLQRVGVEVSGLAGLYVHFLLLSDAWFEAGGLAAWLIPSEFMDVNYGSAIKNYLTGRVRLRQIHRFSPDDAQFTDALVTSAVVIFEKVPADGSETVLMSLGGPLNAPRSCEKVTVNDLKSARKWTNFPRETPRDFAFEASQTTLGDLFTVRRGLVTGSNDFFILSRIEANRRKLPPRFLRPILPSPRYLMRPIIEADSEGNPRLDRSLVLVDCDRSQDEVRRDHPALWSYYEEGVAQGLPQGYLTSRRSPWFAQEKREAPPFVCTYMGRPRDGRPPFRIFWNRSKAVAANVYLLLYPQGVLLRELQANPALLGAVFDRLQEIRPSHFMDQGRVYGGGLHKMEPKELAALPADAILEEIGRQPSPRHATLAGF